MRVFRHRDFRLLWSGALFSFVGSWVQNVAQSWLIYELTHSEALLGLVAFCQSAPVSLLGPIAGALADMFDKRKVLVGCQLGFAAGALYLAAAVYWGFIEYWHILIVATFSGLIATIEQPTRQTTVSRVVPQEELPSALPLQALTFNLARVVGPAIGGILLASFGAQLCYLINGLSYTALILAVLAIRSDLSASQREPQPVLDLLTEGVKYVFSHPRLKLLFLMETIVAVFGLPYIALMPAIAKDMLGLDARGLGISMSMIGLGAVTSLFLLAHFTGAKQRPLIVRYAMTAMGLGVLALSFATNPWLGYPTLFLVGMAAVAQFNSTNVLFQVIAPERLRGRVLSMHIWALAGFGPMGTLLFGYIANRFSIPLSLQIGGAIVVLGAIWGWASQPAAEGAEEL
ncbi:MAG: MFS transporter [Armatimonadetes bacterium]|nr:MAG: MFS transporter [Armatimonadota bacterium]